MAPVCATVGSGAPSRLQLSSQPLYINLHDGTVRFGSALAWIVCKQATVMAGVAALLKKHVELALARLPVMMMLVEVLSTTAACIYWLNRE